MPPPPTYPALLFYQSSPVDDVIAGGWRENASHNVLTGSVVCL